MSKDSLDKKIQKCIKKGEHRRIEVVKGSQIINHCGLYGGLGEFACPYLGMMNYLRKEGNRYPIYLCNRNLMLKKGYKK